MSKINSMFCKIFEPDKNGDIDIESVINQSLYILFWGGVIIIAACLVISGFVYGIYYITNEDAHNHLFRTDGVPPTMIQSVGMMCGLWAGGILFLIVRFGWLKLWGKIKNKPVAHCPVKKEEDESHEL